MSEEENGECARAHSTEEPAPVAVVDPPRRPRAKYQHDLVHYAAKLNCHLRTVKRWIQVGRKATPPTLPPYDDPPAMLEWWQSMQTQALVKCRPPQELLDYGAPPAAPGPPVAAAAPGAVASPPGFDFSSTSGGGLAESVVELRRTLAANQRRLSTAMQADPINESFIASCSRNVEKGIDLLRKAEADLFEMQKKRGDLVPIKDVREDWSTLLMSLRMMRGRMVDNICAELAGAFPAPQLEQIRGAVTREREREEQLLRGARHWKESADVPPLAVAV